MGLQAGVIVLIIVAVIFVATLLGFLLMKCFLNNCCVVVWQEKGAVTERFGKMNAVFVPGVNCKVPCIDNFKEFRWSRPVASHTLEQQMRLMDANGQKDRSDYTFTYVDMREEAYPLPRMQVYTRGAIPIDITIFLIYNFEDIRKCFYEVDNLSMAIYNTVYAQITELFAEQDLEKCLEFYKMLNELALERYTATFASWGVKLHSMQILEIIPNEGMRDTLTTQIVTERQRRAYLILSDGQSSCTKILAEGQKDANKNHGVGDYQRITNTSQGESQSAQIITQADAESLAMLKQQLQREGIDYADYQLADRYIDTTFMTTGQRDISLGIFRPEIEGAMYIGFKNSTGVSRSDLD